MMRKIIFFVLALLSMTNVYAQVPQYNVQMKVLLTGGRRTDRCESQFHAVFSVNNKVAVAINSSGFNQINDDESSVIKITDNSSGFGMNVANFDWQSRLNGGYCYGEWRSSNYTDLFNVYQSTSFWTKRYPLPDSYQGYIQMSFCPNNLIIDPVTGPEGGATLSQNDQTTINATAGFPADAYTWRYQIGTSGAWFDLASKYQGKASISFTGNELLGASFSSVVNSLSKINIGLYAKDINGNEKLYASTLLTPKFNAPEVFYLYRLPAKCSDSHTSSVLIQFKSGIGAGNKLEIMNVKNGVSSGGSFYITNDSLSSSNTYELKGLELNKTYQLSVRDYVGQLNGVESTLRSIYYVNPKTFAYNTINVLPPPLQTQLAKSGIFCNGGQDGTISSQVKGGTAPYSLTYKNTTSNTILLTRPLVNNDVNKWVSDASPITNLIVGDYTLEVRDKNNCPVDATISLIQPQAPLSITTRTITEVSGYGLSNGTFEVKLTGGTVLAPHYPLPTMLHSNGTVYTAQFNGSENNEFAFLFNNLPAGTYALRGEDAALTPNKNLIQDSAGCLIKENTIIVQPAPLLVDLVQTESIICYGGQDGVLVGHAVGGKRFSSGMPYTYAWSYSKDGIVAYTALSTTDSILTNSKAGFYKLRVKDKNNNTVSAIYEITQPLQVAFDVAIKNVTCLNWTDGALTLSNLRGGTAPYTIDWYDGSSAYQVSNLAHGFYTVTVSDALACSTLRSIQVKDTLNGITLSQGTYLMPYCYGDANGALSVKVDVDRPPYTVLWNTGSTDELLTNIKAGVYTVQVLNNNNCLKEASFTLLDPNPIPLDLGETRYLCIDQTADYDIAVKDSVYQYLWEGPSLNTTATKVSLSAEGLYKATITDTKGCKVEDEVQVQRINKTIASEFIVSTQVFAGDEVSLVNITEIAFADYAVWNFKEADAIDVITNSLDYATVIFREAGIYTVGLTTHQDRCTKVLEKQVKVLEPTFDHKPYNGASSFIQEFEVRPNPNDGRFEVMIRLQDVAAVKLRFLDFYSNEDIAIVEAQDQKEYIIPMQVNVAPGTYILFLETAYGTRITKVVIM